MNAVVPPWASYCYMVCGDQLIFIMTNNSIEPLIMDPFDLV